jgi:hypothetical protein
MTTAYPTPDEHRLKANELLAQVYSDAYAPMHPYRTDALARATVHALLAQGPAQVHYALDISASASDAAMRAAVLDIISGTSVPSLPDPAHPSVSTPATSRTPSQQTTPRKRAAKKTTASKEPSK